ncbi:hypothetical protein BaRGS_00016413 [Batillaria attramentaria]|uniref:MBD domain-containing protein n=1 Tax=Batillaria attramentaria TaxID=370345 RepID=A0ABD0KYZ1_9CAEN
MESLPAASLADSNTTAVSLASTAGENKNMVTLAGCETEGTDAGKDSFIDDQTQFADSSHGSGSNRLAYEEDSDSDEMILNLSGEHSLTLSDDNSSHQSHTSEQSPTAARTVDDVDTDRIHTGAAHTTSGEIHNKTGQHTQEADPSQLTLVTEERSVRDTSNSSHKCCDDTTHRSDADDTRLEERMDTDGDEVVRIVPPAKLDAERGEGKDIKTERTGICADDAVLGEPLKKADKVREDGTLDEADSKKGILQQASADAYDEEMVLKPLKEHGWKREVVIRGIFDESKKTPCDVYYFTPDGKKLRSRVMIAQYLETHPNSPLTINNFTFVRKPISEEPWEVVRNAGSAGRRTNKSAGSKDSSPLPSSSASLKLGKGPKMKIGRPAKPKTSPAVPSTSSSPASAAAAAAKRTSFVYGGSSEEGEEWDDGDQDYDPLSESTPTWGRIKMKSWGRKCQGQDKPPDREILIMSVPSPEIIIDRADDSHTMDRHESSTVDSVRETEEEQHTGPHMVLLPDEIKQERCDSDEEHEKRDNHKGDNHHEKTETGAVCAQADVRPQIRPKPKPTARKSTMPRILLKFPSKSSREAKSQRRGSQELVLSDGQLCSTSCPGLFGQPPQLQCCICMCLFHHLCVNVDPDIQSTSFKCLRCKNLSTPPRSASPPKSAPTPPTLQRTPAIPPPPLTTRPENIGVGAQSVFPTQLPVLRRPGEPSHTLSRNDLVRQQVAVAPSAPRGPTGLVLPPGSDAIEALRNLMSVSQSASAPQSLQQPSISPVGPRLLAAGAAPPPLTPSSNLRLALMQRTGVTSKPPRPPPRLTAAPGVVEMPVSTNSANQSPPAPASGTVIAPLTAFSTVSPAAGMTTSAAPTHAQLLTLPAAVMSRLNLGQPLALKINNTQVVVPPSCVISSKEGLKVLLPPSTFPLPSDPNVKLSVTVSNNPVSSSPDTTPTTVTSSSNVSHSSKITTSTASDKGKTSVSVTPSAEGVCTRRRRRMADRAGIDPSQCMMHRLFGGFDSMLHIFRYLGVLDLLRASQVCRTWLRIARQRCLWQHVKLEGLQVPDWDRAIHYLHDVGTRSLCLKGMGHFDDRNRTWHQLMSNLSSLSGLRCIEFGQVPSSVIHSTAEKLTQLEVFRAEHITDFSNEQMWTTPTKVDVGKFASLSKLQELRLRGVSGLALPTFTFSGKLTELTSLQHLHTLSLTSLCALRDSEFHFLSEMKQLEVVELGDCLNWSSETYHQLGQLHKLQRLRLEAGGEIPDHVGLGQAIAQLANLRHLELILFAIPDSLGSALHQLHHLHTLVVWPDTGNAMMPALVNSHAMAAVENLQQLDTLEWGVVIRDEGKGSDPAAHDSQIGRKNSIPLLKPDNGLDPEAARNDSDVQTLSVTEFTQRLCSRLPQCTKIKVFNTQLVGRGPSAGKS